MLTDSLGRRVRYKRQPKTELTSSNKPRTYRTLERDVLWLSFLHRHGGRLPTSYLHDSTKEGYVSLDNTRRRLQILFQNTRLIDRPFQQFETLDPRRNELIHEISPIGLQLLRDEKLFSPYAPTMGGSFQHQVMLSCISASFELNAREHGFTYTPQNVLLERIKRDHTITLAERDEFTPDEVFMLSKDGKDLLIFLEVDRGTEPNISAKDTRKSWKRSIRQYKELISSKLYKERFDVTCGALLVVVTISKAKQANILKVVETEHKGKCPYTLVTNLPQFGREFHPPLLLDMLGTSWARCGYEDFKIIE